MRVAEVILVVHQVDGDAVEHQLLNAHVLAAPAEVDGEAEHVLHLVAVSVLDAAVVRGDDARVYAQGGEALGQGADHVGEAAGLGYGGALRADEQHGGQAVAALVGQGLLEFTFHLIIILSRRGAPARGEPWRSCVWRLADYLACLRGFLRGGLFALGGGLLGVKRK